MLWDLNEGKHLYSLEAGDNINALVFSPNRYWLCAATASCIKIFDLCVPDSSLSSCLSCVRLLGADSPSCARPSSLSTAPQRVQVDR